MMKCKTCGYEWQERVAKVKACPRCKNYIWERHYDHQKNKEGK